MNLEEIKLITKAFTVVGLAAVSAWTHVKTKGAAGEGWGLLAIIVLIFV